MCVVVVEQFDWGVKADGSDDAVLTSECKGARRCVLTILIIFEVVGEVSRRVC